MPDVALTSTDDAWTLPPASRSRGSRGVTPASMASVPPTTTVGLAASAVAVASRSVPAWIVVVPVWAVLPEIVQLPPPVLSRCTVPEPLVIPPAISPRPAPCSVNVRLPVAPAVSATPPAPAAVPVNRISPASAWIT